MKGSVRYIITRPCLSEGSVRLLKYLEALFPQDGPVTLLDDRGAEHNAHVDRRAGRIHGLRDLYHGHNLGVNDVLLITPLSDTRYQVECVVKPITERPTGSARTRAPERPQRVVVNESPYVREVRLERRPATPDAPRQTSLHPTPTEQTQGERTPPERAPAQRQDAPRAERPASRTADEAPKPAAAQAPATSSQGAPATTTPPAAGTPHAPATPAVSAPAASAARASTLQMRAAPSVPSNSKPAPDTQALGVEDMLQELATRVGYRLERLAPGVIRLRADLGQHGYSVLIALDLESASRPEWRGDADYLAVLVGEHERPQGLPRLTREALAALLENARLAPLTPLELRGYWNTGSFDLESAASVAELVSAQLSQRGVFSFVLLLLAQQPPHSVVHTHRLAERLGSGVNSAELTGVLQTLSAAPFNLLSPLGGGQYYLRSDVHDALRSLSEYAEGLRVRLNVETRVALAR